MAGKTQHVEQERGLVGACLGVLFIGILIGASYWILLPFLPAFIWASMIVVSTWSLMLSLQARLKGKRAFAAAILTLGMFLVFVIPLLLGISTIIENTEQIKTWAQSASSFERPAPPSWLKNVPFAGTKLEDRWRVIAATSKDDLIARASPYFGGLLSWFASQVGNISMLVLHFLLTLVLSVFLYMNGEAIAGAVKRFARRLAGEQGEEAVVLAALAIHAVALGVVGTAFCQSLVAGLGIFIAGVPQVVLLTAIIFFFSIIQIGAVPILIPIIIWLFYTSEPGWGIAMIAWTVLVGVMDNVLRPILIRRGANLPLLLIFAGVVGGLIAFGIIGLFLGPVTLAVVYTLLTAWISEPGVKGYRKAKST